jgi:hypothetical protein
MFSNIWGKEFDANDLKMEVRFLDVTFQKGNSLGDLHNRNLDHNNIPRFADTLFTRFNTQWLICSPN